MDPTRKRFAILILALLFFLGIIFRSFIISNIVAPISLIFILIWRVILTLDQKIYWTLLLIAALFYAFYRLVWEPSIINQSYDVAPNYTMENLNYWKTSIKLSAEDPQEPNYLKRRLVDMLVMAYVLILPDSTILEIYESLKNGRMQLPPTIRAFLFPQDSSRHKPTLRHFLQSVWLGPGALIRRWRGQTRTDYYNSVEEVLAFLDSLMEN